jgi:plastocyanin
MRLTRPVFALSVAVAALALAGCGGSDNSAGTISTETTTTDSTTTTTATGTMLDGTVGPGFDISLTQNGQPVTTLTAGTYTINVDDKSDIHDFHLTGGDVDKSTDVSGTGTETWTVDLKAGSYHYQCDPHSSTMNGDFTVSG